VTLEPCAPGARNKEKTACAERVVNARVREVWIGIPDPYPTVAGMGREYLESHGIVVHDFDPDLQESIREANATFMEYAEQAALAAGTATPVVERGG
jgi:Pyrimidine deaminase